MGFDPVNIRMNIFGLAKQYRTDNSIKIGSGDYSHGVTLFGSKVIDMNIDKA
jgi:hypothetical protein